MLTDSVAVVTVPDTKSCDAPLKYEYVVPKIIDNTSNTLKTIIAIFCLDAPFLTIFTPNYFNNLIYYRKKTISKSNYFIKFCHFFCLYGILCI